MNGIDTVRALVQQGYSPVQAAALAGHMQQESGFDSSNVNPKEGAHGLLQWEGPRWDALQSFAKSQGKDPTDPSVQIAFIGQEMGGPEAKSSAAFRSAPDVSSASDALKSYIRFGDDSSGKRRDNAMNLYQQYTGVPAAPVGALAGPVDPTSPIDPTQSVASPGDPTSLAAPAPVGTLASALSTAGAGITKAAGGGQQAAPAADQFLAPQQIAMPQANPQAAQIAALISKQYGIG